LVLNDREALDILQAQLMQMLQQKVPYTHLPLAIRQRCASAFRLTKEAHTELNHQLFDALYRR
jgi:hypothetical protein